MRITSVETLPIDRYLFVQVHTDEGIVGLGEAGTWGFLEAAEQVVNKFAKYLVGEDPLRIEHHWQYMYRSTHFRGAAIMGAISALDIDEMAGGRFRLGLGAGVKRLNETWHSVDYGKPAPHLRETIEATRLIMEKAPTGEPITRVLGVLTILLGLAFLGWLPWTSREWRLHRMPTIGLVGAPLLGVLFGQHPRREVPRVVAAELALAE